MDLCAGKTARSRGPNRKNKIPLSHYKANSVFVCVCDSMHVSLPMPSEIDINIMAVLYSAESLTA